MNEIIGYCRDGATGRWKPFTESSGIATQAFVMCNDCCCVISTRGGPRFRSVCVNCYHNRQLVAFAQGHELF